MKKELSGTFTASSGKVIGHIAKLLGHNFLTTHFVREERQPAILLARQLKLRNGDSHVSYISLSEAQVSALGLKEGDGVDVEVDPDLYKPETGLRALRAKTDTHDWVADGPG